jgi:tetratricopeptide (TPR) repeat protein
MESYLDCPMTDIARSQPRPGRLRSILPPPNPRRWSTEIEFLEEIPPELAIALWRMLRRTRLWAAVPPPARKNLALPNSSAAGERLAAACAHAPRLLEAFGTFALLGREPEAVTAPQLARACHRVQVWAEERVSLDIAALFAEAAATADPDASSQAFDAGRLCRRAAHHERAAAWYLRAFSLAVRQKSDQDVIKALLGYGNLMKDLGRRDEARVYYERVARRAASSGRRRQAAEAHHSLLTLAAEAGMYPAACRHVRKAIENYPIHNPFVPYLVHDFAYVLLENRHFSFAVSLLSRLVSIIEDQDALAIVYASLARAAGGMRDVRRFREAEQSTLLIFEHHQEYAPSVFNPDPARVKVG